MSWKEELASTKELCVTGQANYYCDIKKLRSVNEGEDDTVETDGR